MSSTHSSTIGTVTGGADPVDAGGQLLDRGEIGWIDPGIGEVDHVGPFAGDVRRGVLGAALRRPRRRLAREPAVLQVRPQSAPGLQVDDRLGLPGVGPGGRPVEVEVVVVAPHLDEGLEVALLPSRAAVRGTTPSASGRSAGSAAPPESGDRPPRARPGRRSSPRMRRLRSLIWVPPVCWSPPAVCTWSDDAGRRHVVEVAVLGADDADRHLAVRLAGRAAQAEDRRVGAPGPRRAEEPHPRHGQPGDDVGVGGIRRRGEGDPQVLHQPQLGLPIVSVGARSGMRYSRQVAVRPCASRWVTPSRT